MRICRCTVPLLVTRAVCSPAAEIYSQDKPVSPVLVVSLGFNMQYPAVARRRSISLWCCTGATVVVKSPTKHKLQPLGPDLWNTTYYPKLRDAVANHKPWYIIDAEGQTLGRLAVLAACVLRYGTPSMLCRPTVTE